MHLQSVLRAPIFKKKKWLYRCGSKHCDKIMAQNEKRNCVVQAGRRFLKAVGGDEKDGDARISLAEFEAAFKKVMS